MAVVIVSQTFPDVLGLPREGFLFSKNFEAALCAFEWREYISDSREKKLFQWASIASVTRWGLQCDNDEIWLLFSPGHQSCPGLYVGLFQCVRYKTKTIQGTSECAFGMKSESHILCRFLRAFKQAFGILSRQKMTRWISGSPQQRGNVSLREIGHFSFWGPQ